MLNPDAKPGGKTCRRRTTSVDNGNGTNGSGGRGPDFKRRGRNKKGSSGAGSNLGGNGLLRNGHHLSSHPGGGGPDSTPSPNGPVHPHIGGPGGQPLIELYPESPSLHHAHQYPFPPGRLSPSLLHAGGEQPPFGYPGQQDWGPGAPDYQCGMGPYFTPGKLHNLYKRIKIFIMFFIFHFGKFYIPKYFHYSISYLKKI